MLSTGEPSIDERKQEITVTNNCQDLEASNKVLQRIAAEPDYRIVLYKILEYCNLARPSSDVERTILSFPEMKGAMHSPQLLLSWLEDAGGIEHLAAEKSEGMWCTTPAGRNAVRLESYEKRMGGLLVQEPIYEDIYLQVLQACLSPKSRMEIEILLNGNPVLKEPKVYPSFFIQSLELAGGLVWDEKWKTTLAGKNFLNRQAKSKHD